jgi:hypothetical protein
MATNAVVLSLASQRIHLSPKLSAQQRVSVRLLRKAEAINLDIRPSVVNVIQSLGWCLVQNPNKATVELELTIQAAGLSSPDAAMAALASGFGGPLDDSSSISIPDLDVSERVGKHVYFVAVVDVLIWQRELPVIKAHLPQVSTAGNKHQIRIITSVQGSGLRWADAHPALCKGLSQTIGTFF